MRTTPDGTQPSALANKPGHRDGGTRDAAA